MAVENTFKYISFCGLEHFEVNRKAIGEKTLSGVAGYFPKANIFHQWNISESFRGVSLEPFVRKWDWVLILTLADPFTGAWLSPLRLEYWILMITTEDKQNIYGKPYILLLTKKIDNDRGQIYILYWYVDD